MDAKKLRDKLDEVINALEDLAGVDKSQRDIDHLKAEVDIKKDDAGVIQGIIDGLPESGLTTPEQDAELKNKVTGLMRDLANDPKLDPNSVTPVTLKDAGLPDRVIAQELQLKKIFDKLNSGEPSDIAQLKKELEAVLKDLAADLEALDADLNDKIEKSLRPDPSIAPSKLPKDNQGNVIPCAVDSDGYPILDENGNFIPIVVTMGGQPVLDQNGNPIAILTDQAGDPVRDKNGNIVANMLLDKKNRPVVDQHGNSIRNVVTGPGGDSVPNMVVDKDGNILPNVLTDADGNPVKDHNGNVIPNVLTDADGNVVLNAVGQIIPNIVTDDLGNPVLDENGNVVPNILRDKDGEPIFDKKGNVVPNVERDVQGNPVIDESGNVKPNLIADKHGNLVPNVQTDKSGNPVMDKDGNFKDKSGGVIPAQPLTGKEGIDLKDSQASLPNLSLRDTIRSGFASLRSLPSRGRLSVHSNVDGKRGSEREKKAALPPSIRSIPDDDMRDTIRSGDLMP